MKSDEDPFQLSRGPRGGFAAAQSRIMSDQIEYEDFFFFPRRGKKIKKQDASCRQVELSFTEY